MLITNNTNNLCKINKYEGKGYLFDTKLFVLLHAQFHSVYSIIFASPLEKKLNNAEIIKLVEQLATLTRKG